MQHPLSKRLRYKFEQFMAKGGSSIFISLLIAFLVCFAIIVLIRGLILWFIGPIEDYNTINDFWDHMWYTFLQMTDPGNMYQVLISQLPTIAQERLPIVLGNMFFDDPTQNWKVITQ